MTKQLVILLPVILITATLALVFIRSFIMWKFSNRRVEGRDIELGYPDDKKKCPYPDSKPKPAFESKTTVKGNPRSRKKLRW